MQGEKERRGEAASCREGKLSLVHSRTKVSHYVLPCNFLGTYDFDVTKADKLFEFLVKKGRIKLPEGHSMLRPDGVKEKRYCGFHDRNSHSIRRLSRKVT
jgi:hypothetical protein